jgi:hypothetical protein
LYALSEHYGVDGSTSVRDAIFERDRSTKAASGCSDSATASNLALKLAPPTGDFLCDRRIDRGHFAGHRI